MRIAFSGKKGVGKTSIADELVKNFGFKKFSFATELKIICQHLFPNVMKLDKELHRHVLQMVGQMMRKVESNVWVDLVLNKVNKMNPLTNIVLDDLRYLNEFFALRNNRFILIRVERHEDLRIKSGYNINDDHSSETALDGVPRQNWNLILKNNEDINHVIQILIKEVLKNE